MSKQHEALLLADLMRAMDYNSTRAAAEELRRLHAVNAELVKALQRCVAALESDAHHRKRYAVANDARNTLTKARGE